MSATRWRMLTTPAAPASASRRRTLQAAAGALTGLALPATGGTLGANDGVQGFRQIATALAGQTLVPTILLDAAASEFETTFGDVALVRFVRACERLDPQALAAALPNPAIEAQARWLVTFLYTGEAVRDGKLEAVWYPWCLAWQSATFTKPPAICGGKFGWWTTR